MLRFKYFITLHLLLSTTTSLAKENSFSQEVWQKITPIYAQIVAHPFNQELANGTLPQKTFEFYLAQDKLYLQQFSLSLKTLAHQMGDPTTKERLLTLAAESLTEHDGIPQQSAEPTTATTRYLGYLAHLTTHGSKEALAAGLLPCFWIYLALADELNEQLSRRPNHPYAFWISQYSSASYREQVLFMIKLVDQLASTSDNTTRAEMLSAFKKASALELQFWDEVSSARRTRELQIIKIRLTTKKSINSPGTHIRSPPSR